MVLTNLNSKFAVTRPGTPIWTPAFGLAAALLVFLLPVAIQTPSRRDLTVEEREIVYSTVDRLEIAIPKLANQFERLAETSELKGWEINQKDENIPLVSYHQSHLIFSPSYFQQDSITQQQELLKALSPSVTYPGNLPDIAYSAE